MSPPGPYILVLEYASEVDMVQNVNLIITGQSESQIQARVNIYSCQFRFVGLLYVSVYACVHYSFLSFLNIIYCFNAALQLYNAIDH